MLGMTTPLQSIPPALRAKWVLPPDVGTDGVYYQWRSINDAIVFPEPFEHWAWPRNGRIIRVLGGAGKKDTSVYYEYLHPTKGWIKPRATTPRYTLHTYGEEQRQAYLDGIADLDRKRLASLNRQAVAAADERYEASARARFAAAFGVREYSIKIAHKFSPFSDYYRGRGKEANGQIITIEMTKRQFREMCLRMETASEVQVGRRLPGKPRRRGR